MVLGQMGCSQSTTYSGDGRLVDNGPLAATDRFVLHLDEITLSGPYTAAYTMKDLPAEEFTIGFQVEPGTVGVRNSLREVEVSMRLREGEKTVFEHQRQLGGWTWTVPAHEEWTFAYLQNGGGTTFLPKRQLSYGLTISMQPKGDFDSVKRFALVAKAGGWK